MPRTRIVIRSLSWALILLGGPGIVLAGELSPADPLIRMTQAPHEGEGLRHAIDRGIRYLAAAQLPTGGFLAEDCGAWPPTPSSSCKPDYSPFYTTFVLDALQAVEHPRVAAIVRRGLQYVAGQMQPQGLWRFYDPPDAYYTFVGPDLDDTAVASALLTRHAVPFPDNMALLFERRDPHGAFYTWVDPSSMHPLARRWVDGSKSTRGSSLDDPNDVDCGVNANVLFYLALRNRSAPAACAYVNACITHRRVPECSLYYPSPVVIFYLVTRAYLAGASCLASSVDVIREWLLELQQPDGSWGDDLETACAVASLLHLGDEGPWVDRGVAAILRQQSLDGSWRRSRFIAYYHVTEVVPTAMSLEVLARYHKGALARDEGSVRPGDHGRCCGHDPS